MLLFSTMYIFARCFFRRCRPLVEHIHHELVIVSTVITVVPIGRKGAPSRKGKRRGVEKTDPCSCHRVARPASLASRGFQQLDRCLPALNLVLELIIFKLKDAGGAYWRELFPVDGIFDCELIPDALMPAKTLSGGVPIVMAPHHVPFGNGNIPRFRRRRLQHDARKTIGIAHWLHLPLSGDRSRR